MLFHNPKVLMFGWFRRPPPPLRSILFVCTANITRSPTAEALFRAEAEKAGQEWVVGSAGVKASNGVQLNSVVKTILHKRFPKLYNHRSRRATKRLLKDYHWICAMDRSHRDALAKLNSKLGDRLFVLRERGVTPPPENPDMPDPTRIPVKDGTDGMARFDTMLEIMDTEIPRLFKMLEEEVVELEFGEE